jgi:hypothetical protein
MGRIKWWRMLLMLVSAIALASAMGCDSGGDGGSGGTGDDTVEAGEDSNDCTPVCGASVCGPDGCGGECGVCDAGSECDGGLCVVPVDCDAACAGLTCGFADTCDCGICGGDLVCTNGSCQVPMVCDDSGFAGLLPEAKLKVSPSGAVRFYFQTVDADAASSSVVVLELDSAAGVPTVPVTLDAAFAGFNGNGVFLYVLKGWKGGAIQGWESAYDQILVPSQGTITITSLSTDMGGKFTATLDGVQLLESTIDPQTYAATPVSHGETWCLDGVVLDSTIVQTQTECIVEGTGQMLGDNIADFALQNCNGKWVNLHDSCADMKAMWFVATAGW